MRHFFIRFQLIFVSIILLVTFGMLMTLVIRNNRRWDFTRQKIYSLSQKTIDLLHEMKADKIEALAFYPHDDLQQEDFEIFLREVELHHRKITYQFHDPNRSPQLAKQWNIRELYTVILRYRNREERLVRPNEDAFANTLLRLHQPQVIPLCFVSGHGEPGLRDEDQQGLSRLKEALEERNYTLHEIHLERDQIPSFCQVVIVPGPQRNWSSADMNLLKETFYGGRGILFLVDPMDPGTGTSFKNFMKDLGVRLGANVVVDKMSRMVGGDYLVPFVNQYHEEHPLTKRFNIPTFFPVVRSTYPSATPPKDLTVVPIAFSSTGSWAETNLSALEDGEAAFESDSDFAGPITLAVAVEGKAEAQEETISLPRGKPIPGTGRMVVVGDSDFLKNAYIQVSGNQALGLRMIHWLSKDQRIVTIEKPEVRFQPLTLSALKRFVIILTTLVIYPLTFFLAGAVRIVVRKRTV